jgi:diadenosine tetraphosphate (Ap4A) HIT family hydrolase
MGPSTYNLQCRFCPEMRDDLGLSEFHHLVGHGFGSRFLRQSDNYVAFPALGQIVCGHLLISPKSHYLSIGQLPAAIIAELEQFIGSAIDVLAHTYNAPIIMLEHGAASSSKKAGCCVDHMHLHLLPAEIDLRHRLSDFYPEMEVDKLTDLQRYFRAGMSYLFLQDGRGRRFAYEAPIVVSQFLRRIACEELRLLDRWDWAANIDPDNVRQMLSDLNSWSNVDGPLSFTRTVDYDPTCER